MRFVKREERRYVKLSVRHLSIQSILLSLSVVALISAVYYSPRVSAKDDNSITNRNSVNIKLETEENTSSSKENASQSDNRGSSHIDSSERHTQTDITDKAHRANLKGKLSATNLQICKDHKDTIEQRTVRISQRATKHLELFNNVAARTQKFYLSSGNTFENYTSLTENVTNKSAAATQSVEALIAQNVTIDCEGVEPKAAIATYKERLQTATEALRDYRTSIKDLIAAIKTAQSTTPNDTVEGKL